MLRQFSEPNSAVPFYKVSYITFIHTYTFFYKLYYVPHDQYASEVEKMY